MQHLLHPFIDTRPGHLIEKSRTNQIEMQELNYQYNTVHYYLLTVHTRTEVTPQKDKSQNCGQQQSNRVQCSRRHHAEEGWNEVEN